MSSRIWRTAVAGAVASVVATGGLVMIASPASAHVTVNPNEVGQGSFARVDFRAPTESDTESTTKVEVHFPEDVVIPSVSVGPVPGWSAEISHRTLDEPVEGGHGEVITEAVAAITWTVESDEAAIHPGQFGEFPVSMGPMPEVDELYFRALQTYSDGTVVRWIEIPGEDGEEPPFPAPRLGLVEGSGHGSADDEGDEAGEAPDTEAASGESSDGGSAGVWLGAAGLVAGLAGLALGGLAFVRTRRTA